MRKIAFVLIVFTLIIPLSSTKTSGSEKKSTPINFVGTPKEDFIEGFKKIIEASFFIENYSDAFKSIQTGKMKIDKKYGQTSYNCLVELPDKVGSIYYAESVSYSAAYFSKDWKDETTAQIDFSVTENWIRETLGTEYKDDKVVFDASSTVKTVDVYFYAPGTIPNEKKNNWKVRLSSQTTSKSYNVSIQIIGTKKEN